MAQTLFNRQIKLVCDTLDVSNLDANFRIEKSLKPEPNTAWIKILNLNATHRKQLETLTAVPVRLEVGYLGTGLQQIYFGQLRSAWSMKEGSSYVTEITSGDGEAAARARIQVPIGKGTTPDVALAAIVKAMQINQGNLAAAVAILKTKGKVLFPFAGSFTGNAQQNLTDFCKSADLEWSIQDGSLQILDRAQPLQKTAIHLTPENGLIGSPTSSFESHKKGENSKENKGTRFVNATTLMIPDLTPGRLVVFDTANVKGGYRVQRVIYKGEKSGVEWFCELECRKY